MEVTETKCKSCGALLDMTKAHDGTVQCEYCHTVWTVPKDETGEAVRAFLRMGEHELDVCKFGDAFASYQKAANLAEDEPEAHFGMALAEECVQYLQDEVNKRLQPIVHRSDGGVFSQNKHYRRAVSLATETQRKTYEERARAIDDIRTKFAALKKSGIGYDCFICVKVTEEQDKNDKNQPPRHTEDSHMASTLYHKLKEDGYRPFYSEEEIAARTGVDYEAFILYALYTSPCMLIVCTDESYLQTPWVKNEYTRFLRMLHDTDKEQESITFVFKNTPIERLPGQSGRIQGIPFDKYDTMDRVRAFVQQFRRTDAPAIERKEYGSASYRKKQTMKQGVTKRALSALGGGEVTVSDNAKLKIAADFLARGDYDNAVRFCNNFIAENPSFGKIYRVLFLAQQKCRTEEEWVRSPAKVQSYDAWEKAIAATPDPAERVQYYNALYSRVATQLRADDYCEFIELPDSTEKAVATLTDKLYNKALREKDEKTFALLLKTVTNTDAYVEMNLAFAHALPHVAEKYYTDILRADEGHFEAQWGVFAAKHRDLFAFCSVPENAGALETALFSYGFNRYAADKLIDLCIQNVRRSPKESACLADFLLTMIPKKQDKVYVSYLRRLVEEFRREKQFLQAGKYNDLLLAHNALDHQAYINRCLVRHSFYNPLSLLLCGENLLDDADYLAAINSYAESFPDKDNPYLTINYVCNELNDIRRYDDCVQYLEQTLYTKIEDLPACNETGWRALSAHANELWKTVLQRYRCKTVNDIFDLREDVSGDPDWKKVLCFAKAGGDASIEKDVKRILDEQASRSMRNVAEDDYIQKLNLRGKIKKIIGYVGCALLSIYSFIATFVCVMGMTGKTAVGMGVMCFLGDYQGGFITLLFLCAVALFVMPIVILPVKKQQPKVLFAIIPIILILASVFTFGPLTSYTNARAEKNDKYITDTYILEMEQTSGGYAVSKVFGRVDVLEYPTTYAGKSVVSIALEWSNIYNMRDVTSVTLPENLVSIGKNAFNGWALTQIILPDSVMEIGESAFYSTALTTITIGPNVTKFPREMLGNCKELKSIHFRGTKEQWLAIEKDASWHANWSYNHYVDNTGDFTVYCTDGTLSKSQAG